MVVDLKNASQKVAMEVNYCRAKMMTNLVRSEQIQQVNRQRNRGSRRIDIGISEKTQILSGT